VVEGGDRERHRDVGAASRLGEHVDVAHDRGPRVMIENGLAASAKASMQARVSGSGLRRLVWIGRCSTATGSRCQDGRASSARHVRDVRLDADACAVAVVHGLSARASKART
jgi:hypothetical protein